MPRQANPDLVTDASVPMRRRIFLVLRDARGPLTTKEIADLTGAHVPTVANTCSLMEAAALIDRPDGPRKGYRLLTDFLPEDHRTLQSLAEVYGVARTRTVLREFEVLR